MTKSMVLLVVCSLTSVIVSHPTARASSLGDVDVKLQARVRAEGSQNRNFDKDSDDDKNFVASRFRMSVKAHPNEKVMIFVQPQFTKIWGAREVVTFSDNSGAAPVITTTAKGTSGVLQDSGLDIHQAFMAIEFLDMMSVDLGRFEIGYGDEVVLGKESWSNVARAWDAARLRFDYGYGKTDLFWGKIIETIGTTGSGTEDKDLYGLYSMHEFGEFVKHADIYYLMRDDRSKTANHVFTDTVSGIRIKSNFFGFDYRVEGTFESLETIIDETESESNIIVELGYTILPAMKLRVSAEYFDATKGYDEFYPTGHKWLGIADFFARRNIKGFRVGIAGEFTEKLGAKLEYHSFTRHDNTVEAFGFGNVGLEAGAVSTSTEDAIGDEIDLQLSYMMNNAVSLRVGVAIFNAGDYLKDINGAKDDPGNFGYLQVTSSF